MSDNKIIVRGFSKIGTIVNDNSIDSYITVEFERIKVMVDRKTQTIILPKNCVTIQS